MALSFPIVDPHMHLWEFDRLYYDWLQAVPRPHNPAGDVTAIAQSSYLPADYRRDAADYAVAAAVHVECGLPPETQVAETDWLEELASSEGLPQAIVAGALLEHPEASFMLAAQARRSSVRGVRQILNFHADPLKSYTGHDRLHDDRWLAGFGLLAHYDLSFDMQIYPSQMPAAAKLAARHPATPIIVNHTGMPTDRDAAGLHAWRGGMAALAAQPNVSVKISGLAMVDRAWSVDSFRPFVLYAIDLFGPARCMFASNFPVDRIHGSFAAIFGAYDAIVADFSMADRELLFADTARRVYRLG